MKIELSRNDVGQVLEGLECRLEAYQKTAIFLNGGDVGEFIIEEVKDLSEAENMCSVYRHLIQKIQSQLS